MSFLRSLPTTATLRDVFKAFPHAARPLIEYHEQLMRGPSPLSVAERELIAAYVSGLNACSYCHGIHSATAEALGVECGLPAGLLRDSDHAPVGERLKPLLYYVRQLTLAPGRVSAADVDAVFAAGWNDGALHDAASVCALFNFMNRLVNGLGISADSDHQRLVGTFLAQQGYAAILRELPRPQGKA